MRPEPVEGRSAKVLLAPDKFKGCLTAAEVAAAVAAGLTDARPDLETIMLPVADGGDGTVAAAVSVGYALVAVPTVGPTGEPIMAGYALDGRRAVVELAAVVGLDRLPGGQLDPARCLDLRAGTGDQGRPGPRRRARSCSDWVAAPRPTAEPGWSRRSAAGCTTRPDTTCRRAAAHWPTWPAWTSVRCATRWVRPRSWWRPMLTIHCSGRTVPPPSSDRRRAPVRMSSTGWNGDFTSGPTW